MNRYQTEAGIPFDTLMAGGGSKESMLALLSAWTGSAQKGEKVPFKGSAVTPEQYAATAQLPTRRAAEEETLGEYDQHQLSKLRDAESRMSEEEKAQVISDRGSLPVQEFLDKSLEAKRGPARPPGQGGATAQQPLSVYEQTLLAKMNAAMGLQERRQDLGRELDEMRVGSGVGVPAASQKELFKLAPRLRDRWESIYEDSPEAERKAAAETKLDTLLERGEGVTKYDEATGKEITMAEDSWLKYETQKEFTKARTAAVENFNADLSGGIKGSDLVYAQLAVVLGSVGTGLAGGKNPALEAFNRLIDRDVERQYKEQEDRLKNMDLTNAQTQNMLSLAKADRQSEIAGQLNVIAQATTDMNKKAEIEKLSAQLDRDALLATKRSYNNTAQLEQWKLKASLAGMDVGTKKARPDVNLRKAAAEHRKMRGAVGLLKQSFERMSKKSFGQRLMGWLGKETGFTRDVIRAANAMPEEVATYLNQRTNTLAQVVKALQGSRPSDFDWKKLEVLFPGVLDSKELARADFEALELMMETAALAEIGQGTAAGDKAFAELEALGNALQNIYGKSSDSALGEYTEGKGWSWRDKMTPDQIDTFRALLKEQGQGERGLSGLVNQHISEGAGDAGGYAISPAAASGTASRLGSIPGAVRVGQ